MHRAPRIIAAVGFALLLAACGGGSDDGTVAGAASTTTAADPAPSTTASAGTVDANEASVAELTAAFEAAGIPSASRWAREVEEYRPYPTDDPSFAKLRQELAKYNPSDRVVEQILASLAL
jgi:hypothetical protein